MDGQVLQSIFREPADIAYVDEEEAVTGKVSSQALSEEETRQVEERLRSLGYL
jgi:hypothetical protein